MTVSDWFGFALLLILSTLTVGIFIHLAIAIGQLRRASKQNAPRHSPKINHTQFESTRSPITEKPTRDTVPTLAEDLTKRETQVAHLAARGLTDAEIAAKLFISERTVGNHLYSIYRKLNINSRRELKYILQQFDDDS